ncbi:hypothetical protein MRB53_018148 [Persea americana]|uniref:Uncharacterized protein n=1 Tax=Persea americana TaxID=3435 RepID=A0ACC2M6Z6_PERAE|nr:hypothetical protein MRB53_018148 [Persea americana]
MRVERLVREAGIQLERSLLARSRTVRQRRRPMSEGIVEERRFLERSKRRREEEMQERMRLEMFFQSERGFGCAEGTMARGAFGRRTAVSTELLVFGRYSAVEESYWTIIVSGHSNHSMWLIHVIRLPQIPFPSFSSNSQPPSI